MGLTRSNSGLFSTPGFIVSPSVLSMSSIFGLRSSYMLEYHWLFALLLRSARYFTGVELTFMVVTHSNSGLFSRSCSIVSVVGKRERGGGEGKEGKRE